MTSGIHDRLKTLKIAHPSHFRTRHHRHRPNMQLHIGRDTPDGDLA
jgi:hypothetical protein